MLSAIVASNFGEQLFAYFILKEASRISKKEKPIENQQAFLYLPIKNDYTNCFSTNSSKSASVIFFLLSAKTKNLS